MTESYAPSPRPTFDGPALITRAGVTRHVWGDAAAGHVADWIYASTDRIHCLVFGVGPGGAFRHSPEFRTIFGADEVLHVLEGTLVLANPETGEVLRVPRGGTARFGADTWHHAFAAGGEPLRVLELFAPPPSQGTSGAHARTRPYLEPESWRYGDDATLGAWPGPWPGRRTLFPVRDEDVLWRIDHGALVGIVSSTPQITVATVDVDPGRVAAPHAHAGDELLFVLEGALWVRAWHAGGVRVFELGPEDAAFVPAGSVHEYRNVGSRPARALVGVAPGYGPPETTA